jgi:hypothetical protein
MTVFIAATGGLLTAWNDRTSIGSNGNVLVPLAGIVVAVVFLIFQLRVSRVISDCDDIISTLDTSEKTVAGPESRDYWKYLIAANTSLLNVLAVIIWATLWARAT